MSTETEITLVEEKNAVELFGKSGSLKTLIEKIRKEVTSIVTDVTTEKGRKEIASLAYKVTRSKTKIDEIGKKLGEDARKKIEAINADRKYARDELDKISDEVRRPLTDYEEREKNRIRKHQEACEKIEAMKMLRPHSSIEAKGFVDTLTAITVDESYEEYRNKAEQAKAEALAYLQNQYTKLKKQEDDAAELERLRKAEEDRKRKEREDQIAKEAADKARRDAERAAEAAETARRAAEAKHRAEQAKKEADEQAKRDAEAARVAKEHADKILKIEREKQEAEARHRRELEDAKAKAKALADKVAREAKERADKAAQAIAEASRKAAAEKAEAERKAANKAHRAKLTGEAIGGLVKNKALISGEQAANIIQAIIDGEIPHVTFNF